VGGTVFCLSVLEFCHPGQAVVSVVFSPCVSFLREAFLPSASLRFSNVSKSLVGGLVFVLS